MTTKDSRLNNMINALDGALEIYAELSDEGLGIYDSLTLAQAASFIEMAKKAVTSSNIYSPVVGV